MRILGLMIVCLGLAAPVSSFAHGRAPDLERHTRFGPIVGSDDRNTNGTYSWKGVPFANAPIGALRWKAPVDLDGWRKPRKTQRFADACVQYGRIYGPGANNRYDE